jgi:cell wall-associated NlpC family hydrolase
MYRPQMLRRTWQPLESTGAMDRLEQVLRSWEGTPYVGGQCRKGVGVYCTAFVAAVLDELYRRPATPLPNLPIDIAFHRREGAMAGLRHFLRAYPNWSKVEDDTLEPGDVLVTGPIGGGPGHAMIAGGRRHTIWHASGSKVTWSGMAISGQYRLHAVYRLLDKDTWA